MRYLLFCTIFVIVLIHTNGCPASKEKDNDNDKDHHNDNDNHKLDQDKHDHDMKNNGSEKSSIVQSDKAKQGNSNVFKKEQSKLYDMDVQLDLMGYSLDLSDKSEENRDDKDDGKNKNKWHYFVYFMFAHELKFG